MVTLAAGVLTLGSVADASAAKSGGRVGGQAFRSSAPKSSPRINQNSRYLDFFPTTFTQYNLVHDDSIGYTSFFFFFLYQSNFFDEEKLFCRNRNDW